MRKTHKVNRPRRRGSPARRLQGALAVLLLALAAVAAPSCAQPARSASEGPLPESSTPARSPTAEVSEKALPEESRGLPVLKRYEIPWEKGEALLGDVKDETFGYDEAAFYWMVSVVNKLPAERMKPDEEGVAYMQLLSTPSSYRGKPVTIRGVYASVTPWDVPVLALQKDIPKLYTCYLKEHPAGEAEPFATVVTLEDPRLDFRPTDDVAVKGYFYKVRKYEDQEGTVHRGPMLVAQRLEHDVPGAQPAGKPFGTLGPYGPMLVIFGAILLILIIAFLFVRRIGRPANYATRGRLPRRIRLRRPDRPGPFGPGGPGGETSGPDSPRRPGD